MNLRIFFDSVKDEVVEGVFEPGCWLNHIFIYRNEFPDYKDYDIALIGLTEDRGSTNNKGLVDGPAEIRRKLYRLTKGIGNYKIVDLGNLRSGMTLEETYLRVQEVCEVLLQNNVVPMLIGGSHDLDYGQFLGYQSSNKFLNILTVDAFIDMSGSEDSGMSRHHTHKILVHESHTVFHYAHLAYQTYLVDQETLAVLEKLYFESYRLGQIREGIEEMEPVIRNADILSFDITAIKRNDAPGNANAQPFGLTGEEACQICWYAGLNQKLSSVGFYEYNPTLDIGGQTSGVIATMIWYFVEGFYMRKHAVDLSHPEFIKYNIALKHDPNKLVFYKNTRSEKWWMEVPYPDNKSMYARNSIVPCSYNDYLAASQGEVPGRWIMMHAKLI